MNWLVILCAAVAYWVLGYVWYSLLFGKMWSAELIRHRGERAAPAPPEIAAKLIGTFVCNLIAAGAMAYVIHRTTLADLTHVLRLAIAAGIGFAGTAITMAYIWESKPTKVWFIDAGYNIVGCLLMALIIFYWR
jgi:hypothetical protein